MSKAKKNSVKAQSGDPFTRWLVIGMVALVVAVGAFFSLTSESKESTASLAASARASLARHDGDQRCRRAPLYCYG